MSKQNFGQFSVRIIELESNKIFFSPNFNLSDFPAFYDDLFLHPFVQELHRISDHNQSTYSIKVLPDFDIEIFREDVTTLMEAYLYENATATTV